MGQAALKYDEFDELDQVPIPEGGIATFLTAETGSWADDDDDVPPKGITNVVKIADKLAEYGRNEDEYMVHAAEGETVIPMEVFKQNPALKDKLFAEMRIMGIEPERYVVGNELNSINPVTGQPEFFLKKLFRGLKKIVKKVLPVVATIALTAIGVPPPIASAIVSGAQVAIQGGSLKDSLKAAAIGGISSFAAKGIGDKFNWAQNGAKQMATQAAINTTLSGGKPRDILKSAATAAATTKALQFAGDKIAQDPSKVVVEEGVSVAQQRALDQAALDAEPFQITQDAYDQNIGGIRNVVNQDPQLYPAIQTSADAVAGQVSSTTPDVTKGGATVGALGAATEPSLADQYINKFGPAQTDPLAGLGDLGDLGYSDAAFGQPVDPATAARMQTGQKALGTTAPGTTTTGQTSSLSDLEVPSIGESIKTILTGTGQPGGRFDALRDLFLPGIRKDEVRAFMEQQGTKNPTTAQVDAFIDTNLTEPNFLRRFGPAGAALMVASSLGQEEPEFTDLSSLPSAQSFIDADPQRFRIYDDNRTYTPSRFTITRAAGADLGAPAFQPTPISTPPLTVAEGGGIMNFPRMNGPIEGPGTETSDDIPAMLSDGEFVFTAKAVRGAGRGSREDGMKNMYNMMRQFEARV